MHFRTNVKAEIEDFLKMSVCCLFLFLRDKSINLLLKISREIEYQQA